MTVLLSQNISLKGTRRSIVIVLIKIEPYVCIFGLISSKTSIVKNFSIRIDASSFPNKQHQAALNLLRPQNISLSKERRTTTLPHQHTM